MNPLCATCQDAGKLCEICKLQEQLKDNTLRNFLKQSLEHMLKFGASQMINEFQYGDMKGVKITIKIENKKAKCLEENWKGPE